MRVAWASVLLLAGCPSFEGPFACECDGGACVNGVCVVEPDAAPPEAPDACVPLGCDALPCAPDPLPDGCGHTILCSCDDCEDFSEGFEAPPAPAAWELHGAARHHAVPEGLVRLVPKESPNARGSMFRARPFLARSFSFEASFRVDAAPPYPDGVAFGWFDPGTLLRRGGLGAVGGGNGFVGLLGFVVEVDQGEPGGYVPEAGPLVLVSYVTGEEATGPHERFIQHLAWRPIEHLSAGTHVLAVEVHGGRIRVALDRRELIDAPFEPLLLPWKFGATAANGGHVETLDVLDVQFHCGDASSFWRGYGARRQLTLRDTRPGHTARVSFPSSARALGRADGRDLALVQGLHLVAAQWEDLSAVGDERATLLVRAPEDPRTPIYAYYGNALATSKLSDDAAELIERFEGPLGAAWRDEWRPGGCSNAELSGAGRSACVDDDGRASRTLANVYSSTLAAARGEPIEIAFDLQGVVEPTQLLTLGTAPTGADPPTLAPDDSFADRVVTATIATPAGTVSGLVPGRNPRRIASVSTLPLGHGSVHLSLVSASTTTSTRTLVRVDELIVRRKAEPDGAILGDEELAR